MFSGKTTGREGMGFFTTALFPFSPHPCLPRVRSQATITISSPVNHGTITQEGNHIQTVPGLIERFSSDLEKLFGKCSFYQPMDEKIKTWTLRFPAIENPKMEKTLFDWPIVLQYDVKAKYQLISRKFSGMTFFHPSVCLTNQKKRAFDKPIKPVLVFNLSLTDDFPCLNKDLHTYIHHSISVSLLFPFFPHVFISR